MKKIMAIMMVLLMCFGLCACGKKITEEDVWEELTDADYWENQVSANSDILGNIVFSDCYTFSGDANVVNTFFGTGLTGEEMFVSGNLGTAAVRLEDNTISLIYTGEVDSDGNVSALGEMKFATLTYSYDGDEFSLYTEDGLELSKVKE